MAAAIAAGVLAAGAIGAATHGAFHRNSPIFGRVITNVGPGRRIAMTFDDGPNPEATPRILDALAEANVRAVFFVLGRHAERWPAIVRRIADDGHQIGNHGWHHRKLHLASPGFVREDLRRGADAIAQAAGIAPRFFRAPHGFRAPWVTSIAHSLGERTVGWSLGVWDTDRPGADVIVERVAAGVRPGSIVLLHDGDGYDPAGDRRQTAEALPEILRRAKNASYELVTLPEQPA